MAENTISFPDLASDKFLCNDPDQDAKLFQITFEKKSISHLDHDQLTTLEKHAIQSEKALPSSFLRARAAKWHDDSIVDTAT